MRIRGLGWATLAMLAGPVVARDRHSVVAQTAADHIALGVTAAKARDPRAALDHFEAALRLDPRDYEANWRAAQALVDLGKQTPDSVKSAARDSLYARAESLAKAAVEADSLGPDGHYVLAAAVGRASLTKSKKERVRRAEIIRNEALRAIELDPDHDRAFHVLGRWNAEIMRLSGLTRFLAKSFLGAGIFHQASWQHAIDYLSRAVELEPASIYHHLDLAEVYIDRDRYTEARTQLEAIDTLPLVDVMDSEYKADAARLLQQIEGKKDKGGAVSRTP